MILTFKLNAWDACISSATNLELRGEFLYAIAMDDWMRNRYRNIRFTAEILDIAPHTNKLGEYPKDSAFLRLDEEEATCKIKVYADNIKIQQILTLAISYATLNDDCEKNLKLSLYCRDNEEYPVKKVLEEVSWEVST